MSEKDTVVGYYQWGRKQKPNRGLSVTVSPEAAQPQDSVSWVYKGQHSRVWSNRLFTDVKVNLFGYDFPLASRPTYKMQPPRLDTGTNFTSGAAWDAFDLRPPEAAGHRAVDLLRAGGDGQPRPQGRLRVPARHRQVRG